MPRFMGPVSWTRLETGNQLGKQNAIIIGMKTMIVFIFKKLLIISCSKTYLVLQKNLIVV